MQKRNFCIAFYKQNFINKNKYGDGEGNAIPLQYSCLENPMDRDAWQATVHGVAKNWTQLSDFTLTFLFTEH